MSKQEMINKIIELNVEKEVLFKEYTKAVKQWNKLQNEKNKQLGELGDKVRGINSQIKDIQDANSNELNVGVKSV